jgi:hypothetical protein
VRNTAVGVQALLENKTGSDNIALGFDAGDNLEAGSNNIYVGNMGPPGPASGNFGIENNTIRIGTQVGVTDFLSIQHPAHSRTFIAGIHAVNEGGSGIATVYINSAGRLGTTPPPSSRRFKNEIKPMDKVSEAILALNPVTFHYKSDNTCTPQFGLIAEEVAKVNPDLVVRDENGEIYTVRYDAVNAMLLNEFLKEHRRMEEQDKRIEELTAQLKQQAALIQNVRAQVEMTKPTPQVVSNQ